MPPLDLFLPWVVEACSLPVPYAKGREIAYQLLCKVLVTHWHTNPPPNHLAHFYHLMYTALQPSSVSHHGPPKWAIIPPLPPPQGTCAVAVKYGSQLFSHGLAGSSVLLQDCVSACGALLASPNSTAPHNKALYLLGSMLHLPALYPSHASPSGGQEEGLKERIVEILYVAAVRETARISRCIALYLVGTLVFCDLFSDRPSPRLPEGVDILLASLQVGSAESADLMRTLFPLVRR